MGGLGLFFAVLLPFEANAFSLTSFIKSLFGVTSGNEASASVGGADPFPFLAPSSFGSDPRAFDLQFVDGSALVSSMGPLGNIAEAADSSVSYKITTYTVREGDTLSLIAETFDVSVATIRWANNIPQGGQIRKGDTLVILPVSGVQHTVLKGDTIASIAKKYSGDPDDIYDFNGLTPGEPLEAGVVVVIPDGEISLPPVQTPRSFAPTYVRGGGPEYAGYYMRPIVGGVRSRGLHGFNGVDLARSCGSPIYASAAGTIITARSSGWNGGYGEYVVIAHGNGTQTLYAHLSAVLVNPGSGVVQGQQMGLVGSTGKSTGCHVHFEIRGAKNPF